jgi:hypothetical protein
MKLKSIVVGELSYFRMVESRFVQHLGEPFLYVTFTPAWVSERKSPIVACQPTLLSVPRLVCSSAAQMRFVFAANNIHIRASIG